MWLRNPDLADLGWFETDIPDPNFEEIPELSAEDIAKNKAKSLLAESDWSMMPDVPITKGKKIEWMDYRRALREIKLQSGFPNDIKWPNKP
ncbi:Phage tail assembly chaperone protein [uncultured Caudovirales phage]|uniref:Phage tail assembly chaperone protein n=1 Tax=uncultured Caudovirales phage TaxID=2100421 RepID=A0A6J7WVA7_9CAUD|nr:Phage tail assembly chaperone protein [uncultured Caudovirales phage]